MGGFRDLQYWLRSHLFPGQADGNRRPDGGTSCYRPIQRKNPEDNQRQAYQEAPAQQIPVAHSGFTDMNPPATGMYTQAAMSSDPYGYGAAQAAQQEYRAEFAAGKNAPEGGNISYMPNAFAPGSGNSYTHVEHVMAVTSLSTCYEAIECMKNGETVIVTMDSIGNESESIRCQDMLAGAAFTLGCTVRMLQAGAVVLIASAGVKVLPEQHARYSAESVPASAAAPASALKEDAQRTRRMSQNAVGWKNAFSEENRGYNPYTGSMPAAAGDYSGFGGYSGGSRENSSYAPAYGNGTYGNAGYGADTGYGMNTGYGTNTGYGMNPGYDTNPGYGGNGGYDTNPGYGGNGGYGANPGYGAGYAGEAAYGMNGRGDTGFAANNGYTAPGYGGSADYMNNPGNTGYFNNPGYGTGYQAPNAGYGY